MQDQTTARPGSEAELVAGSLDQHPSVPIKFQTQWICWKFGKLHQEAINSEPQTSRIKQTYMLTPVSSFEAKWAPIQIYPNGSEWDKNSEMPTMFQPTAWNAKVGVHSPESANETFKQTSWKASCHRYHSSISRSVLSKVEITVVLWNAKATVCPLLPSLWLELAPFKNEHPKFVWWRWLISRMESKARLTMRDISFKQTQSSITDQQSQRHVKGFRKHLYLGIMSFY